jgi:hypothetical protein
LRILSHPAWNHVNQIEPPQHECDPCNFVYDNDEAFSHFSPGVDEPQRYGSKGQHQQPLAASPFSSRVNLSFDGLAPEIQQIQKNRNAKPVGPIDITGKLDLEDDEWERRVRDAILRDEVLYHRILRLEVSPSFLPMT